MTSIANLSARRFGKWVALRRGVNAGKVTQWLCKCDCGAERLVRYGNLVNGLSRSCGCVLRAKTSAKNEREAAARARLNPWTPEQIDLLRKNYPTVGKVSCASLLGRSIAAVRGKASALKIKFDRASDHEKDWQTRAAASKGGRMWTTNEITALTKNYPHLGVDKCAVLLARRPSVIRGMAGHLGLKLTPDTFSRLTSERLRAPGCRMQTDEYRQMASDRMTQRAAINPHLRRGYSRGRQGKRPDLGMYFRSSWEANYARYLNWLIARGSIRKWEYEPETFWFHKIKRGTRSYCPDFKIWENDGTIVFHEVKGWLDATGKTKLQRMAKYYPHIKLIVIDSKQYRAISRFASSIPCWERPSSKNPRAVVTVERI